MGPSRAAETKQDRRAGVAIQQFRMHSPQPGRASEEALAEVDLGTRVSNSSKLSLEHFGDCCTQFSC